MPNAHAKIGMTLRIRPTSRPESKEGRLAPPHLPPLPAAAPRASPDRNVLMYLRTGSAGPTQPSGRPRGRRRALLAKARRGRCETLPGFCSVSSAVVASVV
jgi:hypothetical protein